MVKTLTRHGNSLALVIERPVLDLLHIREETLLEVSTDGRSLIISPVTDKRRREFLRAKTLILKKYRPAFRKLAG